MFDQTLRIALTIFACYRLTGLIVYDKGPFGLFKRLRAYLGMHHVPLVRQNLGSLVNCPYCVGVWMAILGLAVVLFPSLVADGILLWLAIAGGQDFLQSMTGRS